jgi:hypothetical protein
MNATLIAERNRHILDALVGCVEACNACNYWCNEGAEGMGECGRLCVDCAAICDLTHTLLARDSRWAAPVAAIGAQISAECAAECGKHDDEYCRQCVQACRESAERCRELAERH